MYKNFESLPCRLFAATCRFDDGVLREEPATEDCPESVRLWLRPATANESEFCDCFMAAADDDRPAFAVISETNTRYETLLFPDLKTIYDWVNMSHDVGFLWFVDEETFSPDGSITTHCRIKIYRHGTSDCVHNMLTSTRKGNEDINIDDAISIFCKGDTSDFIGGAYPENIKKSDDVVFLAYLSNRDYPEHPELHMLKVGVCRAGDIWRDMQ